ncbi:MAG: hypothetical protein RLZZ196_679 [Bacteroidota bacterium]|jgi:hypothetical protein
MKIKGWEKISGYTYKGYSIVNPIHNAGEDIYYATILDLNQSTKPKWDITLSINDTTGVILFRINDNVTQHLLAKSHLTKPNIHTLQKFREQYEMLVDDILEQRQSYVNKATTNINNGTTGIINRVYNTGTAVTYSIAPQSGIGMLPKSGSISTAFTQAHIVQTIKDLQEEIDKLNLK